MRTVGDVGDHVVIVPNSQLALGHTQSWVSGKAQSLNPVVWLKSLHSFKIKRTNKNFVFWPHLVAGEILVAPPGIAPMPSALAAWGLNHWTAREVPQACGLSPEVLQSHLSV